MNLVGKTLSNRYELLEEVGIGGMATVYKAKCTLLNRFVAVKVLKDEFSKDAEFVKKFRAEAQSAASLTHPNIVSVYDVGEENGINYIVMEYLEGDTLKDYIEKNGRLSNEVTLKFASQIASALEAAHSAKIIHRDIKPQNIVLANNNTIAKVTDFGIAKMSSKDTITSSSTTIGSVHYFSPEHAKGCYTDEKSDIYSLGVVMYEMSTGTLPFNADSPVTVALKQIQEVPTEPKEIVPSISNRLNDIIMKSMAKSTVDRYQNAAELLDDIFAAINSRSEDYNTTRSSSMENTQIVPIIGLKDDTSPSIADENNSEVIASRKALRTGKKLSEIEEENAKKQNEDKVKKKKKRLKVLIITIISIIVIVIGTLIGNLIYKINRSNEQEKPLVEIAPNLVGENYEQMKEQYEALGLKILVSKYVESTEVKEGHIIEQSVIEGETLTENEIEVVVSKGVKKVEMIDVVGKDYTVAKYELESIGLKPQFKFVKNEEIEKNIIISQTVKKGEQIAVGTTIEIDVSDGDGKIRVIVPSVVGQTYIKAKQTLEKLNLKVTVEYTTDNTKADGVVLSQSLKENSEVVEKTEIKLTINRLQKTKTVTISLSTLASNITEETVSVRITAQVEGVTNTVYNQTHTKQAEQFDDFTIDVNGFDSAKITVYINSELAEEKTISF